MSKTDESERKPPLSRPVTEDGIVAERDPEDIREGKDELNTGLAETGGNPDERKIA